MEPNAFVEGNRGGGRIRSTEPVRTVGGVAACNFRCGEADHSYIGSVRVRGVGTVHCDVAIASARREPARTAKRGYEHAAIGLTLVLERQRSVSIRPGVRSLIPAPHVKTAGDSADGLDVDCPLRVHSHAGLDRLSCPGGQTETLIGIVLRGSRTNACRDSLTIRAVVLAGRVGWRSSHSHIDSDRVIGNAGRRVEPGGVPQKVPVGRGYNKYRDRRWGGDGTVTSE